MEAREGEIWHWSLGQTGQHVIPYKIQLDKRAVLPVGMRCFIWASSLMRNSVRGKGWVLKLDPGCSSTCEVRAGSWCLCCLSLERQLMHGSWVMDLMEAGLF